MMLFRFFYNVCLHLLAVGMLPKVLLNWKKYRQNLSARLGKGFPEIEKGNHKLIWVHAVSLGETKAIAPLIKQLKNWDPSLKILLSCTTQTGSQEGKKNVIEADWHVFLPFDFPYIVRPIVKKVAPDYVILTETDFWYHFQDEAKKNGAKLIVVNGKLSKSSFLRYKTFSSFTKYLLKPVDAFFLQGNLYKERFEQLSLDSSKLIVTGNIKLVGLEQKSNKPSETTLTLGSTHAPEEEIWLNALKTIWKQFPELKVRIVPRHPERFEEVAKLLEKQKIDFGRFSKGETLETKAVLLVDTTGILRDLYAKSTIAFVGGSFTRRVGGHNILEPCFYGKPVLFGPFMHSQPDFLDLITTYEAGIQITEKSLIPTLTKLLSSPDLCERLGENGLRLIQESKGALEKTLNHLINILRA